MLYMLPVWSLTGAQHTQAEHKQWEWPAASCATPGNLSFQPKPLQLLAHTMAVYRYQFQEQFTGTLKAQTSDKSDKASCAFTLNLAWGTSDFQ